MPAPARADSGQGAPLLQLGSQGPAVAALNRRLAALTYLRAAQVSRVFTRATFHGVMAFQKHSRLVRDGIAGPQTRAALGTARRPTPILSRPGRRIEVSLRRQIAFLVAGRTVRRTVSVSTGRRGYATPTGSFSVYRRERLSWSRPYRVWLPWAAYFHPRGIAFHSSPNVPARPVSHGCVRVPPPFAREVYRFAQIGTRVLVR
jgi:peptidoglycan hydrolase-like protein with peptidoglycan-binding domain